MSEITRRLHQALQPYHWKFASMLPLPARRHYLHTAATRRLGNFRTPTRFTEKVNWRIINDRRPIIAEMSDKLRAKEIARERVPGDELRIPQTYWSGTDLASRLSDGMDMLRVDLYSVGDDVWFGEYTPYPCGGTSRYSPRSFDVEFGAKWTLPPLDAIRS